MIAAGLSLRCKRMQSYLETRAQHADFQISLQGVFECSRATYWNHVYLQTMPERRLHVAGVRQYRLATDLRRPNEVSFKNVFAAGVASGMSLAPEERLPYLSELKRVVRGEAKRLGTPDPFLRRYPAAPEDLPEAFRSAYFDDPPANVDGGSARALNAGLGCRRRTWHWFLLQWPQALSSP